jgi:hypothetical protein
MPLADQGIDEQIAADWATIREKHTVEPETPAPVPVEEPPPEDTAPAEPENRARDATGKFVKAEDKPESVKAAETPKPIEEPQPPPAPAPEPQNASQRDVNRPPSTWKPTARAEWEKLPPSVRAEIHRRESDFMAGQHQLLPDAKLGSDMRKAIEPYRMMIEAEGGTPDRAVSDLLRTAALFRVGSQEQKLAAIGRLVQQFGIDISPMFQQAQQGQPQPQPQQQYQDPRVDQLFAMQRQQEQERQQQEYQRQQRENGEREAVAAQFMNEVTADGKPARPYLGDVIDQMAALVPVIRAENASLTHGQMLQEAYDRATWANPEIRALLQTEHQAKLDAQRRAANQTQVADARRAASVNVPRRGSTPAPGKPGSLEDTIREGARALGLVN